MLSSRRVAGMAMAIQREMALEANTTGCILIQHASDEASASQRIGSKVEIAEVA
jgi:hypothetical protein